MSTATALDEVGHDPAFTMGNRIAKRRKDLGLDQAELAALVGVSRPLVSKWERDISVPDVVQAVRLAQVLECSFGWLCGVDARSRCSSETRRSGDISDGIATIGTLDGQVRGQRILAFAVPRRPRATT
jgi:transcriptional regulator with XRE-family HTH domain